MKTNFESVYEIKFCELISKLITLNKDGTYINLFGGFASESWNLKNKNLIWHIKGSTGRIDIKLCMDDVAKHLGYKKWRAITKSTDHDSVADCIQFIGDSNE